MTIIPRITGLVQGVTYAWRLEWPNNTPAIVIDPAEYYAEMTVSQYAEAVPGVETSLRLTGGRVLGTLSTGGHLAPLKLYPTRLDITLPRAATRRWPLQATEDPVARTEGAGTATYTYPDQILYAHLQILRHDGGVTPFPDRFEFELEMQPRLYANG